MEIDKEQRCVARGMALAALTTLGAGSLATTLRFPDSARLPLAATALLAIALPLTFCIMRLALHRFRTPGDIVGSASANESERARLLQAMLQNTLEQTVLAVLAIVAAAALLPIRFIGWLPALAICFVVGRSAFIARYRRGAGARAYGFALTFYPAVALLLASMVAALQRLA